MNAMMLPSFPKILIGALVLSSACSHAGPITVNAWELFPDTQGENGFYALAYNPSSAVFRELADRGTDLWWTPQTQWDSPSINGTYSDHIGLWSSGTYSNWGGPEDAVLAFVAPISTTYQISGSYYINPSSGNGKTGDRPRFSYFHVRLAT